MGGPNWLSDLFAALMLLTAAYCVSRLVAARRLHKTTETDVEVVHIVMGIVMAGMLVGSLQFVPTSLAALFFAFATLWFGWNAVEAFRGTRGGVEVAYHHALPHVVLSFAMFYMLVFQPGAMTPMTNMNQSMGSSVQFAPLGAVLAVALFGYAVWFASRLAPAGSAEQFELAGVTERERESYAAAPTAGTSTLTDQRPQDEEFLAPRLGMCSHIVMCVVMGYMLIVML